MENVLGEKKQKVNEQLELLYGNKKNNTE